jgi:hypothetical protein
VRKHIGRHYSQVAADVSNSDLNTNKVKFTFHTGGANPLVPGAPDIDTYVDFSADFSQASSAKFDGTVRGDSFPNAEVIIIDADGNAALLFDFRTAGGRNTGPLTRLFGAHADTVLGSFSQIIPANGDSFVASVPPPGPTRGS